MSKTIKNIISEKKYASMFEKEDDTENTILLKRFIKLYMDSKDKDYFERLSKMNSA